MKEDLEIQRRLWRVNGRISALSDRLCWPYRGAHRQRLVKQLANAEAQRQALLVRQALLEC